MSTQSILDEAKQIVGGDRQQDYGSCVESFERIARLWSAYKGVEFTALEVSMMMTLLKVSRSKTSPKRDTFVDIAGYAECAGQITAAAHAATWHGNPTSWTQVPDCDLPKTRINVRVKPAHVTQPPCFNTQPDDFEARHNQGCLVCQWSAMCQPLNAAASTATELKAVYDNAGLPSFAVAVHGNAKVCSKCDGKGHVAGGHMNTWSLPCPICSVPPVPTKPYDMYDNTLGS